jgi:hypothetical protein
MADVNATWNRMFPRAFRNDGYSSMAGFVLEPHSSSQANIGDCRSQAHQPTPPAHGSIPTARLIDPQLGRRFQPCDIDALLSDSARSLACAQQASRAWFTSQQKKPTIAETVCSQALGVKKTGAEKPKLTKPKMVREAADFTELMYDASPSYNASTAGTRKVGIDSTGSHASTAMATSPSRPLLERSDDADAKRRGQV